MKYNIISSAAIKRIILTTILFSLIICQMPQTAAAKNGRHTVTSHSYNTLKNEVSTDNNSKNTKTNTDTTNSTSTGIDTSIMAKAAVLIENNSGRILYEKEKDMELIPASITKIMTLLLIFEAIHSGKIALEDSVTVSEYASSMGGSQVYLEAGETQTVDTMIKCISIASANDAAVAMAEYVSGSESEFVKNMNNKAKELGMMHTSFKNCNGLDDNIKSGHYSSAYDVALMSRELVTKYPEISNYSTVWMDEITHTTKKGSKQFGLTNTNKLIRTYNGITGLKTGSTAKAKYCLSATAERGGISLTAVIMAAPDPKERFAEAASLLDYGFANCTNYSEKASDIPLKPQKISHGKTGTVTPIVSEDFSYTLCGSETADKIERKVMYKKNLTAPIKKGDTIGTVLYRINGMDIKKIPITAGEDIKEAGYIDYFYKLAKRLLLD